MEQGTASQPNLASLDRLTGKAVFFPSGSPGGTDLGLIEMHKLDFGAEREKFRRPVSRSVLFESEETIAVAPVFAIEGRQFHTAILPLLLNGRRESDVTQLVGVAALVTFIARLDQAFDLGAVGLSNLVLTKAGSAMNEGVDYYAELKNGLVRFPSTPAGIADGDTVTARFDQIALVWDSYTALSDLSREGTLKIWEMDRGRVAKNILTVPGIMSAESPGEGDPFKHRKWKLRFSLTDLPSVLRRRTEFIAVSGNLMNVLTLDDGTPVTLDDGSYVDLS